MGWDFVCYDKETQEIIVVLQDIPVEPKFLINMDYVGIYIPHDEYKIINDGDRYYFKNMNNILYLDEYRGRYVD